MIFERFYNWHEEILGLMGGISFVLMGVFAYFIYLEISWTITGLGIVVIILSALTALFFQLPRIKGVRAVISTFVGGITLALTIIVWVYTLTFVQSSDWIKMVEASLLSLGLLITSFFGFGFLFIALIPPQGGKPKPIIPKKAPKKKEKKIVPVTEEEEEEEDFIDRL